MPREGTPLADPQGRIPEAPVGHRQPRPQDLPPSGLRNEGGGANSGGVNADRPLKQRTADLQRMLIGAALPCLNPSGALESGTTVRS